MYVYIYMYVLCCCRHGEIKFSIRYFASSAECGTVEYWCEIINEWYICESSDHVFAYVCFTIRRRWQVAWICHPLKVIVMLFELSFRPWVSAAVCCWLVHCCYFFLCAAGIFCIMC